MKIKNILKQMEIRPDSISFYTRDGHESPDLEFGTCDLTGEEGMVVDCEALDTTGEVIQFQALDDLVHGELGSIAGAF